MLFIFDWDGTLLDSTDKIVRCMHTAIDEVGLPGRNDEQARNIIGLGLPEGIRHLFPAIDEQGCQQLIAAYGRHYVAADQVPCSFYPQVESVLEQLRAAGHQLSVATGKSRRGLNRVLANLQLSDFFDASRCADETASKPHPLMVQQLLAELAIPAGEAILVGDTEYDLEMATNAGVRSIGVSYGAHARERLLKHNPMLLIDRFEQLLELEGL